MLKQINKIRNLRKILTSNKTILATSSTTCISAAIITPVVVFSWNKNEVQENAKSTFKKTNPEKEIIKNPPFTNKNYEEKYSPNFSNSPETSIISKNANIQKNLPSFTNFYPVVKRSSRIKDFEDLQLEDFQIAKNISDLYSFVITKKPNYLQLDISNKQSNEKVATKKITKGDVWNLFSENYLQQLDQGISKNKIVFEKIKFSKNKINTIFFSDFVERFKYKNPDYQGEIKIKIGQNQFANKTIYGNLEFTNAIIENNAFLNAQIQGSIELKNSIVENDAFKQAKVDNYVSLEDSQIREYAFGESQLNNDLRITKSLLENESFKDTKIKGNLRIENSPEVRERTFDNSYVSGDVSILNTTLKQDAFKLVTVEKDVELTNTEIGVYAFGESQLNGDLLINDSPKINKQAFEKANISGKILIENSKLEQDAFKLVTAEKDVELTNTKIGVYAFGESQLNGDLLINDSPKINKQAFEKANISGKILIENSKLEQDAFKLVTAEKDVELTNTKIGVYAFGESQLNGDLTIKNSSLLREAFKDSKIKGNFTFDQTEIKGNNVFIQTKIEKDLILKNSNDKKYFNNATIKGKIF